MDSLNREILMELINMYQWESGELVLEWFLRVLDKEGENTILIWATYIDMGFRI